MRRAIAILGAALVCAGCSGKGVDLTSLVTPKTTDRPPADSPAAALRLLEWSYNNRDTTGVRDLITADYRFVFSPYDSAGAPYATVGWRRADELASTAHLFVTGNEGLPPAAWISLTLDKNFYVSPDPDYSASDPYGYWHKNIRTQAMLHVQLADGSQVDIVSGISFFLVRSDSAVVPTDFASHAAPPDTTRWWIRRWVDEAVGGTGLRHLSDEAERAGHPDLLDAQPSSYFSWGRLKALYR